MPDGYDAYSGGLGIATPSPILEEARGIATTPGPSMAEIQAARARAPAQAAYQGPSLGQRIGSGLSAVGDVLTNTARGAVGQGLTSTEIAAQRQTLANAQLESFVKQIDLVGQVASVARRAPEASRAGARKLIEQNAPNFVELFDTILTQGYEIPKTYADLEQDSPEIAGLAEAIRTGQISFQEALPAIQKAVPAALENRDVRRFDEMQPLILESFQALREQFPDRFEKMLSDRVISDSELENSFDMLGVSGAERTFLRRNKAKLLDTIGSANGVSLVLSGEEGRSLEMLRQQEKIKQQFKQAGAAYDIRIDNGNAYRINKRTGTVEDLGRVAQGERLVQTPTGPYAESVDAEGKLTLRPLTTAQEDPGKVLTGNVIDRESGTIRAATEAEVAKDPKRYQRLSAPQKIENIPPKQQEEISQRRLTMASVLGGMKVLEEAPIGAVGARGELGRFGGVIGRAVGGEETGKVVSSLFAGGPISPDELQEVRTKMNELLLPTVRAYVQSDTTRLSDRDMALAEKIQGVEGFGSDVFTVRESLTDMMRIMLVNDNLDSAEAAAQGALLPSILSLGLEPGISEEESRRRLEQTAQTLLDYGFDDAHAIRAISEAREVVRRVTPALGPK